uniref:PIF-1 n=1 Tax=Faxonius propinquus nudivirus TaxID=3139431 RepID=A0AAU8GD08_9VIRU
MEFSLIFFISICIIFIFITLYLKISLNKFNTQYLSTIQKNQEKIKEIPKFSYNIHFKNPPNEINIENPYMCTVTDLKKCEISDPFSCIGCQNLLSSCVNFEKDTKYINIDGTELLIPANIDSNEGYCLKIKNSTQACNPYHGVLVLIETSPTKLESMLYCECINPGYVGKNSILGACDTPFICNGHVLDINKPLSEIICQCNDTMIAVTVNNTPTCQHKIVKDYTYTDDDFLGKNTVPSNRFISDIEINFPGTKLLDPCKYCLLTGNYIENGIMVPTEDDGWQCVLATQITTNSTVRGLPIRRNIHGKRLLKGVYGPDAVIDIAWINIHIYGYVESPIFENSAITFYVKDNMWFFERLNYEINTSHAYAINLLQHQGHYPGTYGTLTLKITPKIGCHLTNTFNNKYECRFSTVVSNELRWPPYSGDMATYGNFTFMRYLGYNSPTSWAHYQHWRNMEKLNTIISGLDKWMKNKLRKIEINPNLRLDNDPCYLWSSYSPATKECLSYLAEDTSMWEEYNAQLIPQDTTSWNESNIH